MNGELAIKEYVALKRTERVLDEKLSLAKTWSETWWSLLNQLDIVRTQSNWLGNLTMTNIQTGSKKPDLNGWVLSSPAAPGEAPPPPLAPEPPPPIDFYKYLPPMRKPK